MNDSRRLQLGLNKVSSRLCSKCEKVGFPPSRQKVGFQSASRRNITGIKLGLAWFKYFKSMVKVCF
jgi:hypothetical protein